MVGRLRKGIASHNLMMMTVLCVDYMISILSLTVIQIRGRSHQSSVPITNIQPSVLPSLRFLIRTEAQGHDSKVCRTSARSKETVEEEEADAATTAIVRERGRHGVGDLPLLPHPQLDLDQCQARESLGVCLLRHIQSVSNKMGSCVVWNFIDCWIVKGHKEPVLDGYRELRGDR